MKDRLLNSSELETQLELWKEQHGEERGMFGGLPNYVVPTERAGRQQMYKTLMELLISKYGYDQDDLKSEQLVKQIIMASVPMSWKGKTLPSWIDFARKDWGLVVARNFEEVIPAAEKDESVKSDKKAEPFKKKSRAEIIPDVPDMDLTNLKGPKAVTVIDESVDIFAFGDGKDS
jgi:hypothetical protein